MNKKLCYSLMLSGLLAMTGCNKQMGQFKSDYFSTNPNPLEVVGGNIPATVTGNIPAKFFKKNAVVAVTPVLVYGGQELSAPATVYQGEKVRGNNTVINYDRGGYMTVPVNYVYLPAMQKSELYLAFNVTQGNKQYVLPRVKVADGVIATAALADAGSVTPAIAPDKFQRIINEKYMADILFLINRANLREGQLNSADMKAWNDQLLKASNDTSRIIEELNISSFASPDGPYDFNAKLAADREHNTKSYLEGKLKKDNITEFGELTAQFTPEDWEGFQKLVSASNIQDKDLILSVLKMYKDPEIRDREIRNMSNVFEELAETILPQLRYSRLTASINVIGKSDEEINKLVDSNPKALTEDELLYAATLTNDLKRKQQIYTLATRIYPNDFRGFNNLGMVQYESKDFAAALASFKQADKLAPKSPEVQMNLGLCALLNKDYTAANRAFGQAGGLSELNDALGVYYLKQGDTAAAVKAFGNSKTNNAGLAQILAKDYSKAKATLAGVANPDATTYYLMAVLGARTNNSQMVTANLREAIKLDPAMAKYAANDIEFSKVNLSGVLK